MEFCSSSLPEPDEPEPSSELIISPESSDCGQKPEEESVVWSLGLLDLPVELCESRVVNYLANQKSDAYIPQKNSVPVCLPVQPSSRSFETCIA